MKPRIAARAAVIDSRSNPFVRLVQSRIVGRRFSRYQQGLTGHMRGSRRHRYALSSWLMLTIAAGAVVALAFVNFFSR